MDKSQTLRKASLGGSIVAAITASLCCIGPLVAVALGAGGFAASAMFEKWRPVVLGVTFALLALAWYLTYRKPKTSCEEGSACATKSVSKWNKVVLWFATAFVVAAAAFPSLSPALLSAGQSASDACCSSAPAKDTKPTRSGNVPTSGFASAACCPPTPQPTASAEDTNMRKNTNPNLISLFEVPLECSLAPQIGCGLRAKPILLELQNDPNIVSAWLNSAGTVLAVVGTEGSSRESRAKAVQAATMAKDGTTATELTGEVREEKLKSFLSDDAWYRGAEVDALSKQEAGIIAARLIRRVQSKVTLTDEKAKALESALADASYRFVSGQADVPRVDFVQQYDKELLKAAAQANLDEAEITALQQAVAQGYQPASNEK